MTGHSDEYCDILEDARNKLRAAALKLGTSTGQRMSPRRLFEYLDSDGKGEVCVAHSELSHRLSRGHLTRTSIFVVNIAQHMMKGHKNRTRRACWPTARDNLRVRGGSCEWLPGSGLICRTRILQQSTSAVNQPHSPAALRPFPSCRPTASVDTHTSTALRHTPSQRPRRARHQAHPAGN